MFWLWRVKARAPPSGTPRPPEVPPSTSEFRGWAIPFPPRHAARALPHSLRPAPLHSTRMWEAAGGGGLAHNEPQQRSQRGRLHNRQAKQAGGGEPLKRPCAHSLRHSAASPPPWNNPQPARSRREMASPSHTSGRSPPKESGPAHPQFANCPACAAKWTRPPGAGWDPGASRGCSSVLGSVLAVKKTSALNGQFLPRPTFQARRRDSLNTRAPLLVASGTARTLRNPRANALPDIGRQPDQPAPGRAAASFPRYVATSSSLSVPELRVRRPHRPSSRDEAGDLRPGQAVLPRIHTGVSGGHGIPPHTPDGSSRLGSPATW